MPSSLAPAGSPQRAQAMDRYAKLLSSDNISELAELDNLAGMMNMGHLVGGHRRRTSLLLNELKILEKLQKKAATDKLKAAEKQVGELVEKRDTLLAQLRELSDAIAGVALPADDATAAGRVSRLLGGTDAIVLDGLNKAGHDVDAIKASADALNSRHADVKAALGDVLKPLGDLLPARQAPQPKPTTYKLGRAIADPAPHARIV